MGASILFDMALNVGEGTPMHTRPADESLVVLGGELLVHLDRTENTVGLVA